MLFATLSQLFSPPKIPITPRVPPPGWHQQPRKESQPAARRDTGFIPVANYQELSASTKFEGAVPEKSAFEWLVAPTNKAESGRISTLTPDDRAELAKSKLSISTAALFKPLWSDGMEYAVIAQKTKHGLNTVKKYCAAFGRAAKGGESEPFPTHTADA